MFLLLNIHLPELDRTEEELKNNFFFVMKRLIQILEEIPIIDLFFSIFVDIPSNYSILETKMVS